MITNIFLNSYQQPENKLTYNFLALIELLNDKKFIEYLIAQKVVEKPVENIKTVFGGGRTNPDGSLEIQCENNKNITVFIENKTNRRGLSDDQLLGHLKLCKNDDLLLVTSPRKSDIEVIKLVNDKRIVFRTWQEISHFLNDNYDDVIVKQFVEYGKKTGEFDELGELYFDDLQIYSQFIKTNFYQKLESIFKNFEYEFDFSKFGFNFNHQYSDNWGRIGIEFSPKNKNTFGQFGAISLYYDIDDHGIKFKNKIPEIAFFLDIDPDFKPKLQTDNEFYKIIDNLVLKGFESNLQNEITDNSWRLIFFRKPITEFRVLNVQELVNFTEFIFKSLLNEKVNLHKYFNELM